MIVFPNCKINLGLHILNKRPDGFHNIETAMVPIPLSDALEFQESENDQLSITGISLDTHNMNDNLVYKALLKCREFGTIPPLKIHLHKAIPSGAGLGGGSADAAFMISALNHTFGLNMDQNSLHKTALELGSDCPFFIENRPTIAEGRGEKLSPIDLNINQYKIAIIVPTLHISTALAYSKVKPNSNRPKITEIIETPIETWEKTLINDFELALFGTYPQLAAIKKTLYKSGAKYASLSGSGSALFGLYEGEMPSVDYFPNCNVFHIN